MPGEIVEPNETPEYAEHVNDPTHPAGNKDLAREMAFDYDGMRLRNSAAEDRKAAQSWKKHSTDPDVSRSLYERNAREMDERAESHGRNADSAEEYARTKYLESHPELTQAQETVKEAGDTVLGAVGIEDPAEESEPEILKGEAGNSDPATQKWREENWEHDGRRAHDMANAGDDLRSIAVDDRRQAEEAAKREEEAEKNLEDWGSKDDFLRREYENQARSANFEKNQSRSSARMWDSAASAQEEWAGVLHDHPVSEKYQEDHPEARFTPEGLRTLEDHLLNLKFEAKREVSFEEAMEKFNDPNWGSKYLQYELGYGVEPEDDEENEKDHDIEEYNPELAAILNNGIATMDDLKNYFRNKERRYYEESRRKIIRLEKILEDVKSGKAFDYTGEEGSSEDTGAAR
jgi:hypothetical protein